MVARFDSPSGRLRVAPHPPAHDVSSPAPPDAGRRLRRIPHRAARRLQRGGLVSRVQDLHSDGLPRRPAHSRRRHPHEGSHRPALAGGAHARWLAAPRRAGRESERRAGADPGEPEPADSCQGTAVGTAVPGVERILGRAVHDPTGRRNRHTFDLGVPLRAALPALDPHANGLVVLQESGRYWGAHLFHWQLPRDV